MSDVIIYDLKKPCVISVSLCLRDSKNGTTEVQKLGGHTEITKISDDHIRYPRFVHNLNKKTIQ